MRVGILLPILYVLLVFLGFFLPLQVIPHARVPGDLFIILLHGFVDILLFLLILNKLLYYYSWGEGKRIRTLLVFLTLQFFNILVFAFQPLHIFDIECVIFGGILPCVLDTIVVRPNFEPTSNIGHKCTLTSLFFLLAATRLVF